MTNTPANQSALAKAFKQVKGVTRKSPKAYLELASEVMNELRGMGFRLVPFPPLKARKGGTKAKKAVG